MTEQEMRALEKYVKTIASENSIILIQIPEADMENYSKCLAYMNNEFGPRFNIIFVPCPMNVKITVVPAHSGISLDSNRLENEHS